MIYTDDMIIQWLIDHTPHDRVLRNALMNHRDPPLVMWNRVPGSWSVSALSTSGKLYGVDVIPHHITGEPHTFQRNNHLCTDDENDTPPTV